MSFSTDFITGVKETVPNQAFSGADMTVVIGNRKVGSLSGLTVSITREVAALYGFGSANPKTYVKGKRGIAGTLVFTLFDRNPLLRDVFRETFDKQLQNLQNVSQDAFVSRFESLPSTAGILTQGQAATIDFNQDVSSAAVASFTGNIDPALARELQETYDALKQQRLRYADQLPSFDITVTMVNQSGSAAFCVIGGVDIVNEGYGLTMNDLSTDVAYTYVARQVVPLTSLTGDLAGQENVAFSPIQSHA